MKREKTKFKRKRFLLLVKVCIFFFIKLTALFLNIFLGDFLIFLSKLFEYIKVKIQNIIRNSIGSKIKDKTTDPAFNKNDEERPLFSNCGGGI